MPKQADSGHWSSIWACCALAMWAVTLIIAPDWPAAEPGMLGLTLAASFVTLAFTALCLFSIRNDAAASREHEDDERRV